MATSTVRRCAAVSNTGVRPHPIDDAGEYVDDARDVIVGGAAAERHPYGCVRWRASSHRDEHVARLHRSALTGRTARYGHTLEIQADEQAFLIRCWHADVADMWQTLRARAVDD